MKDGLVAALAMLLSGAVASAATVELPQTGQDKCYDSGGNQVGCSGTGQDGEIRAGTRWPNPRFTSGIGAEADCITDHLTGLTWVKNLDGIARTWQAAIDHANALSLCGFGDWRIPSVLELESLVNAGQPNQAIWLNTQGFSNVKSLWYWTSTTYVHSAVSAWNVALWDGVLTYQIKTNMSHVWPVRGGSDSARAHVWETGQQTCYDASGTTIDCVGTGHDGDASPGVAWPSPRFTENGDGTVTDNLTGLVWLEDANCFGAKPFAQALIDVRTLADGGCGLTDGTRAGDWRLPNRKELLSLLSFEHSSPALSDAAGTGKWTPGDPFDAVLSGWYWSSTPAAGFPYSSWRVWMPWGLVGFDVHAAHVWPVRGSARHEAPIATPAMTSWGLIALGAALWSGGVYCSRRRRAAASRRTS